MSSRISPRPAVRAVLALTVAFLASVPAWAATPATSSPARMAAVASAPATAAAPAAPGGAQAYAEECAACHIAFPSRLLGAASWRAVMAGLGDHFGVDASLDAATTRAITAYLEQNAGYPSRNGSATGQPPLRITETPWFQREHHELTPAVLKRQAASSAADCSACHAGAARGEFEDEHGERGRRGEHGERGGHERWGHDRD